MLSFQQFEQLYIHPGLEIHRSILTCDAVRTRNLIDRRAEFVASELSAALSMHSVPKPAHASSMSKQTVTSSIF